MGSGGRARRLVWAALLLGWLHIGAAAAQAATASRLVLLSAEDEAAYADAYAAVAAQDWPLIALALRRVQDRKIGRAHV